MLLQLTDKMSATDTRYMILVCMVELENLLAEVKRQAWGYWVGWEQIKGAFLAKKMRNSIKNLHW